jgi:hypothetical protein
MRLCRGLRPLVLAERRQAEGGADPSAAARTSLGERRESMRVPSLPGRESRTSPSNVATSPSAMAKSSSSEVPPVHVVRVASACSIASSSARAAAIGSEMASPWVALGQAALWIALPLGHAGELGDLGFHDRLGEDADALTQEVDIALGDRPCAPSRARPSCPRSSWCSSVSWVLSPTTRG